MVRIFNKAQKEEWVNYSKQIGTIKGGYGCLTFQEALGYYNNSFTEVWVAYVSNKPVTDSIYIDKAGIEMYMSVTTSVHAIFITHMGIQRVPSHTTHKNISPLLHEFCAKIMHELHPEKLFMINTPTPIMREILLNSLKKKPVDNAAYIYDKYIESDMVYEFTQKDIDSRLKFYLEKNLEVDEDFLREIRLFEDLVKQREKVKSGRLFPHICIKNGDASFIICDKYTGKAISNMSSDNPEFNWFFKNTELFITGITRDESPVISIDLIELSNLSGQFDLE